MGLNVFDYERWDGLKIYWRRVVNILNKSFKELDMVEIIHWNPRYPVFKNKPLSYFSVTKPVNNFGDLIGPMIVKKLLNNKGLDRKHGGNSRLLTVGSILHLAESGDCVWGSGKLGNVEDQRYKFKNIDVRAVRGPLTRDFLLSRGVKVPEIYGDPALLLPHLFPKLKQLSLNPKYDITIVPHFLDLPSYKNKKNILNPRQPVMKVLERIVQSKMVVGSSLHAIIIAEAFGIPARLFQSQSEHIFKYQDYYNGTGRETFQMASSVKEAIEMGGEREMYFDHQKLLDSFPYDLWTESAIV